MANTHESKPQDMPNGAVRVLEERIEALERQIAESPGRAQSEHPAIAPSPLEEELSAQLERHRDQLRDYEKALVDRIADVDDDCRATASRLQRAWHTQREEIDDRLRRSAGVVAGLLVLFAVLVAVALFLVYRQATTGQPELAADVVEIRQKLASISTTEIGGDRVLGELARLAEEVKEVSSSVARLRREGDPTARLAVADERAAREESEARGADEIRRLEAEQGRLTEELESLRATLGAVESERSQRQVGTGAASSETPDDLGLAGQAVNPKPEESEPLADTGAPEIDADSRVPDGGSEGDGEALVSAETLAVGEGTYALQLIGFFDQESLTSFAAREELPEQVYFLREVYKGSPWYALIHSLHEGYAAAVKEYSSLPEELASLNPWIRPMPAGTVLRILEIGPGGKGKSN